MFIFQGNLMDRRYRKSIILHLLVWAVALASYLAVIFPLARVLGLDLEALIVNLAQDYGPSDPPAWFADTRWIGWGKLLLAAGTAPLYLLFFAGLGYRLLPRRWTAESPVLLLPSRVRLAVAVIAFALYAAACFPLSLGLVVWLQVEAYWWIQWYQNLDPVMEWIRLQAPLALLPGLIIAGAWAAWFVTRRRRQGAPRPSLARRAKRAALLVVTLPALAVALGPLVVGALHAGRILAAPGPGVFEAKCGGCHDLALSLYYIKTPVEWERTVKTQMEEEQVQLTPDEQEAVLGFLVGARSFSDRWTFRTRCQRCHFSTSGWADRSPADWSRVVDGLARWSPYYFRADIKDQLVRHLSRTRSPKEVHQQVSTKTAPSRQEAVGACSRCHSLSHGADRYRGKGREEILHLVKRMNRKLARPQEPSLLPRVARGYGALIHDPQQIDRLFPHDRPREDGWVKW